MSEKNITYRLIPKKTPVWSTALQENITFDKDMIIKITLGVGTDAVNFDFEYVYGKLQLLLFNMPGFIPTLLDKANGDIGIDFTKTLPYAPPAPDSNMSMFYKGKKI